jgi:hypothetical protein
MHRRDIARVLTVSTDPLLGLREPVSESRHALRHARPRLRKKLVQGFAERRAYSAWRPGRGLGSKQMGPYLTDSILVRSNYLGAKRRCSPCATPSSIPTWTQQHRAHEIANRRAQRHTREACRTPMHRYLTRRVGRTDEAPEITPHVQRFYGRHALHRAP